MIKRAARTPRDRSQRWWPTPSSLLAGTALFIALGGSAAAATGLIHAANIAPGAITSKAIRDGAVEPKALSSSTRALFVGQFGRQGRRGLGRGTRRPRRRAVSTVPMAPTEAPGPTAPTASPGPTASPAQTACAGANGIIGPTGVAGTERNERDQRDQRDQRNERNHRAAVGQAGRDCPAHRGTVHHGRRTRGTGGQLRRLREERALPNRSRRQCRMSSQVGGHHHRPGRNEDAARAGRGSGGSARGDHRSDVAHPVDPSVQCGRSQRVGQLQQPDRDPDRLSGPSDARRATRSLLAQPRADPCGCGRRR